MREPCSFVTHALNHVIFFRSLPELSLANSIKDGEGAEASTRAQSELANMDKVIWKQRLSFRQNNYYPKGYMGWRMTDSMHQLFRKGSEDYIVPQAKLDNTHSVPEKKNAFSLSCRKKYTLKN